MPDDKVLFRSVYCVISPAVKCLKGYGERRDYVGDVYLDSRVALDADRSKQVVFDGAGKT